MNDPRANGVLWHGSPFDFPTADLKAGTSARPHVTQARSRELGVYLSSDIREAIDYAFAGRWGVGEDRGLVHCSVLEMAFWSISKELGMLSEVRDFNPVWQGRFRPLRLGMSLPVRLWEAMALLSEFGVHEVRLKPGPWNISHQPDVDLKGVGNFTYSPKEVPGVDAYFFPQSRPVDRLVVAVANLEMIQC